MNYSIFFFLYNLSHKSIFLDWFIIFCAKYLIYLAVIFVFVYIIKKNSNELFDWRNPFREIRLKINRLIFVFGSVISSWIVVEILKNIFVKPRPFIVFADKITPLWTHGSFDSFPSGHAAFFGALAASSFFVDKKLGIICTIVGLLVGLSRIAGGIHFPIDIFVGYILGIAIALIFRIINKKHG